MTRHGTLEVVVSDRLGSYGATLRSLGVRDRQKTGRWLNNRAENSHLPFRGRERAMLRFRRVREVCKRRKEGYNLGSLEILKFF
jgi:putative transposase